MNIFNLVVHAELLAQTTRKRSKYKGFRTPTRWNSPRSHACNMIVSEYEYRKSNHPPARPSWQARANKGTLDLSASLADKASDLLTFTAMQDEAQKRFTLAVIRRSRALALDLGGLL